MTDPRFDPMFQRGYSGPEPELVVREVTPARPKAVPDVAAPVVDDGPVHESVRSPAETTVDPRSEEIWAPQRRNPFALAMLVSGVVLIVAGAAMTWSLATQITSNIQTTPTAAEQVLSFLNYLLPPALFLGGILGVLGWLILGALGAPRTQDRTL